MQMESSKRLFTNAEVTLWVASPPPHLPTWMGVHCRSDFNVSVCHPKELIFLISILQIPSGIPQTSCVLSASLADRNYKKVSSSMGRRSDPPGSELSEF